MIESTAVHARVHSCIPELKITTERDAMIVSPAHPLGLRKLDILAVARKVMDGD